MAAMMIVMMAFLLMAGHHGFGTSQDAKPAGAETTYIQRSDAATREDGRQQPAKQEGPSHGSE